MPGPVPTCAVREEHEQERSPGHGAHRTLVATVGLGCPRPPFLPLTLPEEGRHANRGLPRARPAHLSALMLELSSQPRFRGWRGVPSWETLEEAPAETTQVPAHGSLHSGHTAESPQEHRPCPQPTSWREWCSLSSCAGTPGQSHSAPCW